MAPIKKLTILHLELCGAHLLSQMLAHVQEVLNVPKDEVHAGTDGTVVLRWLTGDSRNPWQTDYLRLWSSFHLTCGGM